MGSSQGELDKCVRVSHPGRVVSLADSPVRLARKSLHKTIIQASEASGVHWQTWFLTENGCYEDVPLRIADYLERVNFAVEEYYEFRRKKQREFGEKFSFGEESFELPLVDIYTSPIQALRKKLNLSKVEFAKSLAVQTAHVFNCERGKSRRLPEGLYSALKEAGLAVGKLEQLDDRQEEFFEWVHAPCP